MSDHYVVIGLARSRQAWFSELARWSTTAVAPIEFVKCLSAEETLALLASGRRVSLLLADAGLNGVDRDLLATAAEAGASTVIVDDGRTQRDWDALGAVAVLEEHFDRAALIDVLRRHAQAVDRTSRRPGRTTVATGPAPARARVLAVVSSGGSGGSTIAMAAAQALAELEPRSDVALVDGARRADLGVLHDIGDVVPGLPDLVEAHRHDDLDPGELRRLLFDVSHREYALLLGSRRPRDWAAMPPRAVRAALDALARSYGYLVIDQDPDLDGEPETGSVDVEDMHSVARAAVTIADVVLAVGVPGPKGVHSLIRLLDELLEFGTPSERIQPVINRAPRSPASRSTITRTLAQLVPGAPEASVPPPLFLPTVRRMDDHHESGVRLPDSLGRPLGRTATRLLSRLEVRDATASPTAGRIAPGELGLLDAPVRFGARSDVA